VEAKGIHHKKKSYRILYGMKQTHKLEYEDEENVMKNCRFEERQVHLLSQYRRM
jgi:ribosomal protein S4E